MPQSQPLGGIELRVAFVFPPFSFKLHEENLRVVEKYFAVAPPLSMSWVAAIAERAGHEATIIDARTLHLTMEDTLALLEDFRPDLLGFMMTTYMFRETLAWLKFLKAHLKVPTIIGGYNLRIYPKESMAADEDIDFGCVEHALHTFPAFLREMEGQRRFDDVPGFLYKRNGEIVQTPNVPVDFNEFPFPARHLLPNELYVEFPTERRNVTVMVTSLGCPMRCTFCELAGTAWSPRRPELVVAEMEECYRKYGVREIDIFDYDFCVQRERTMQICKLIQAKQLDLWWHCRTRVDRVDPELLQEMYKAGCRRIFFGIEHGDQAMLDRVNKGITLDQIRKTIAAAREIGIRPLGFFLIGSPGETVRTIKRTISFAKELKLDYVQFSKTTAKPGTGLWKKLVADSGGYDHWKEYILGRAPERALPRPWTELSTADVDRWTKKAYVRYHSRPLFLLRSTLKVRSWSEFKRKAGCFLDMVFSQERRAEDWYKKGKPYQIYRENPPELVEKWRGKFVKGSLKRANAGSHEKQG